MYVYEDNCLSLSYPFLAVAAAAIWLLLMYTMRSSISKIILKKSSTFNLWSFCFVYHLHILFSSVWFVFCAVLLLLFFGKNGRHNFKISIYSESSGRRRRRFQLVNDQIMYRISTFNSENCPSNLMRFFFVCLCILTNPN